MRLKHAIFLHYQHLVSKSNSHFKIISIIALLYVYIGPKMITLTNIIKSLHFIRCVIYPCAIKLHQIIAVLLGSYRQELLKIVLAFHRCSLQYQRKGRDRRIPRSVFHGRRDAPFKKYYNDKCKSSMITFT